MSVDEVLNSLKKFRGTASIESMAKFGIDPRFALGVNLPSQRKIARGIKTNHRLALELWETKIHEARIIASMIADPQLTDEQLMESWVADFYSWDICDQCCINLFRKIKFAESKALEWSTRTAEFEKRAGFALMATLAVHLKNVPNDFFLPFLDAIERESNDPRNFVKKAVNWALRQVGKRNMQLNQMALSRAEIILKRDSRTARWIATDAIRELSSEKTIERIKKRPKK